MEKALRVIRDDPVAFARYIVKFEPFPYQEKILRDNGKRLIVLCGRQIGKSTIASVKLIHFALTHPKTTSIVVSATLRQSMETFAKVEMFIDGSIVKYSVRRMTRTQVWLKNGSRIICLPSGRYGAGLRGLTVHFAVIDEAAFIYPEVIENVIFPMLSTTDGTVWMLTTPWDREHITYKAFTSWPRESVYHFPSSINPLITQAFLDEQKQLIGEERFNQEYLAQFVDDAKSYFPATLLRLCVNDCLTSLVNGEYYLGYDPGGKQDPAAYVVVEKKDEQILVRSFKTIRDQTYTSVNVEVSELCKKHGISNLGVDQTGIGNPIVEHLKELGLNVKGYVFTNKTKEEMLGNLKLLLEQKKITLPDSPELLASLNCIEYERTRVGGYTFSHRNGTHDDLAYALALACLQVKEGSGGVVIKL